MKLAIDIPTLQTERLILREHRVADFPAVCEMWNDPAVTKYIGRRPRPEEECWLKFLRAAGFWAHLGYGFWIIEDKETGAVAGEVGFGDFKREMTPSLSGEPEAGWVLAAPFHGRGVGSEAVRAIIAWGDEQKFGAPMSCIIEPGNKPSIRVAEKFGFVETTRTTYHGDEVIVFHRTT